MLVLFCAEMHREWLVYPSRNTHDKWLQCFASEVGGEYSTVAVCVFVCDQHAGCVGPQLASHHTVSCAFNPAHFDGDWLADVCAYPPESWPDIIKHVSGSFFHSDWYAVHVCRKINKVITGLLRDCIEVVQRVIWDLVFFTPTVSDYGATVFFLSFGSSYCFVCN